MQRVQKLTPSKLEQAAKEILVAAKVRTAEKKAKYRQFEEGSRNISIPFTMEARGFSSSAVKVINKLMAYYEDKGKWTEQRSGML